MTEKSLFTQSDMLGIYMSGTGNSAAVASLGGYRSDYQARLLEVIVRRSMPTIKIEHVTGSNCCGIGYIRATGENELVYTDPAGATGESVTILPGETQLLVSEESKSVRVSRDSADTNSLSGEMQLEFAQIYNNAFGMENVSNADRLAGLTTYRGLFLYNHGPWAVFNVKLWTHPDDNISLAFETPVSGQIQAIPNETTAPSGLTWNSGHDASTGLSIPTFSSGATRGLWLRRNVPAGSAVTGRAIARVYLQWYDGETYLETMTGLYRVAGEPEYRVYVGENTVPDFTAVPKAKAASLPISFAVTPPATGSKELRVVCRKANKYGIETHNVWAMRKTIDSAGDEVLSRPTQPSEVQLINLAGGQVLLMARYHDANDDTPATAWRYYLRADGTDPDPATDTPTVVAMSASSATLTTPAHLLTQTLGPYAFGANIKVLVRTYNGLESSNSEPASLTVTRPAAGAETLMGAFYGASDAQRLSPQRVDIETVYNATYQIKTVQWEGVSELWHGSTLVWRLKYDKGSAYAGLWTTFAFKQEAIVGSALSAPVDVTSATVFYITSGGIRRMKIDVAAKTISFDSHMTEGDLVYSYSESSISAQAKHTLFQVRGEAFWHPTTAMSLNESGRLARAVPWRQRATTEEFL